MNAATFLLAINFAIGLSFATTFLALTRRSDVVLGPWFAAGFLCAAATVTVEAFAGVIPSVRLTSTASFALLMLALTTIAAGLVRHYRPHASLAGLFGFFGLAVALNALVVFDLPRGSWGQALGYQLPFAATLAVAAGAVLRARHRPVDLALAAVLGLSALQFVAKAVLAGLAGSGPGVRDYVFSTYAFYSQTAGGILSLFLGLSLLALIVTEVLEETKLRLRRDPLSGLLNRAAFVERVTALSRRPAAAASCVILCDIDRFKSINDRFGHAAGDEVIRAFGINLRAHFGADALCGRLGGEEFCVLLPGCGPAEARAHLEAVRSLTRRTRYARVPAEVAVTASFGIAMAEPGEPFDATLHRADMALYEAKADGRDCYRFAAILVDGPMAGSMSAPEGTQVVRGDAFRIRDIVDGPSTGAT